MRRRCSRRVESRLGGESSICSRRAFRGRTYADRFAGCRRRVRCESRPFRNRCHRLTCSRRPACSSCPASSKRRRSDASALALVRVRLALKRSGQAARSRRLHQAEFQPRHAQTMRQLVRRVPNNSRSARAMFPRRFGEKSMLETALNAHSSRPMAGAATRRRCWSLIA